MRLRFDETTLSKNPKNPISTDVEPTAPPSVANYLDLCHVPAAALPWLFTRPLSQVNAAAMVAKTAYDAGQPVASAALLRHDHNILVFMFQSGTKLAVYPDGGIGHEGQALACTPEVVQSLLGPSQNDAPMDAEPGLPMDELPGVQLTGAQIGIPMDGMSNMAADPIEPAVEELGDPELGQIGDPIELSEPMIDSEFFGDKVDGESPTDQILAQVGAVDGPANLNLSLMDDKGSPKRGERRRR